MKEEADDLAPLLAVVFRRLLRLGSFPVYCRVSNVSSIPKGPPSFSVDNYRLISFTPTLSKILECLVSVRLGGLLNAEVCFQPPCSLTVKVMAHVIPFCMWHTPYSGF